MHTIKGMLAAVALSLFIGGTAWGLDVNDIANLIKNGMSDSVIINLVRSNRFAEPLTANDVMLLSANGASTELLTFLTGPEASLAGSGVSSTIVDDTPIYYTEYDSGVPIDGNTYYMDENGNYIAISPSSVQPSVPSTVYYYSDDYYPSSSSYYDYVYDYGYPQYSTPIWGGFLWGDRPSHRPSFRPDHRPPPPPSHRPGGPGIDRPRPPSGPGGGPGHDRPRPPTTPGGPGHDRPRPPSGPSGPNHGGGRPPGDRPKPPSQKPTPPSDQQTQPRPPRH